jgi:kynurenine formamidase
VLLDVPRFLGISWLEPGSGIGPDELVHVADHEDVRVETGDVLLVRTGHERRRDEVGEWDSANWDAGLEVETAAWLSDREVSVLGSDGDSDVSPSRVEHVQLPIHVLALAAMGMLIIDNLHLESLASVCEAEHRWEFLVMLAPLRIPGGTGSPVNPIVVM